MNINALKSIDTLFNQETASTTNQIAVGEPNPSSPISMAQRAMTASFFYLAAMLVNSLNVQWAQNTFRVVNTQTDELGWTHVRMQQTINGLPIYGQQIITHVDNNGTVRGMSGDANQEMLDGSFNVKPSISQNSALNRVRSNYHGSISAPSTELLVYPTKTQGMRLAYKVEFFDTKAPARMTYFIDARNGRILDKANSLSTVPNTPGNTGVVAPAKNTGIVSPYMQQAVPVSTRRMGDWNSASFANYVLPTRETNQ